MDLLFNAQSGDKDLLQPVPGNLKKKLLPWMTSYYREYPFGYSLVQRYITSRFNIHFWHIYTNGPGRLYPVCFKPTIAIQAMLGGEIQCKLSGFGDILLSNSKFGLFYVPSSVNEAWLEPGTYDSFHIELENGFLECIAENCPDAGELIMRLRDSSKEGLKMISVTMSYKARTIVNNIRDCDKTRGDMAIMLHRYIVDLLSEYITGVWELEKKDRKVNTAHEEILQRIAEYIIAEPNIIDQELKKLCTKFGLNATELKRDFKKHFNQTPASFVRFHALNKAHYLLTTTNQSIDLIADEVGYGYRSNLDKAFKKQFGILPSKLRK